MRPAQAGLAIILRTRSYHESDKIVTFLTRDFGKLTGIAKGAKNSRRRFANCLDPLTRVRVYFRTRAPASLVFMESCDLLGPATRFAEPRKFAYGSYLLELTDQLTAEGHEVPELYDLLEEALHTLESGAATSAFLRAFELHLLHLAGYAPHLETCAVCHEPLALTGRVYLDPAHGGTACERCAASDYTWLPFAAETLRLLEELKQTTLADAQGMRLAGALASEAAQFVGRLIAIHVGRPLKSIGLIATLRAEQTSAE